MLRDAPASRSIGPSESSWSTAASAAGTRGVVHATVGQKRLKNLIFKTFNQDVDWRWSVLEIVART